MPNPVLTPERWQQEIDEEQPGWASPQAGAAGIAGGFGGHATRGLHAGASPSEVSGGRMTVAGTATALGVLFVLFLFTGAIGWSQVTQTVTEVPAVGGGTVQQVQTDFPGWIFLPMLAALVLGLVTAFKPKIARFTAPLYALGYGFAVGAISHMYDIQYEGIVLQAVGATLAVFAVMWFLYVTRIIKVTQRFVTVVLAATAGIVVMYLAAFVFSIFGADILFWDEPTPLGIAISAVIVIVAAFNLAIDFAFIDSATEAGAPKYMEWYGAFGLMVTLIWLYLSILRLLSLLRN